MKDLICSKGAEKEFQRRIPTNWKTRTLKGDLRKAQNQIKDFSTKMGLLKASWTKDYQDFLISERIFTK